MRESDLLRKERAESVDARQAGGGCVERRRRLRRPKQVRSPVRADVQAQEEILHVPEELADFPQDEVRVHERLETAGGQSQGFDSANWPHAWLH